MSDSQPTHPVDQGLRLAVRALLDHRVGQPTHPVDQGLRHEEEAVAVFFIIVSQHTRSTRD